MRRNSHYLPFFVYCCVERDDFFVEWMAKFGFYEDGQLSEVFSYSILIHLIFFS